MRYINRIYIILILIIFTTFIYLYNSVSTINEKMVANVEKILITKAGYFANNIDQELKNNIAADLYETLKSNPELRERLEHTFSVVITPSFKYIYMLYRDKNGNYRYLIDGSKEDKGDFNQKLNVDKKKWNRVYETKQPQIIMQNNIDGLYITYLTPIFFDNEVKAVLSIDFSTKLITYITEIVAPIENIFVYIFFTVVLLLLILLYQVLLNIRTKKDSITDPLTLVYNRNYLRDFLKKNNNLADYKIAMLDIDYFKKINDNYGHKAGDFILTEVALIIKSIVRQNDIVIRFGGEEFLILLHKKNIKDVESDTINIANRMREDLSKNSFIYDGIIIRVTASIGIELYPERFKTFLESIKSADEKLYIAKKEGRNKVVYDKFLSKKNKDTLNNQLSIHDIKEALDEGRVICHYQPIVDLTTDKTIKYEALVRILDKQNNIIYPGSFLDTINNTNVYNDLTRSVLNTVIEVIYARRVPISINLNLSDILDNVIYKMVINEIKENKEIAELLTIELLEYEQLDTEILRERLLEIKSYGTKIALDDFGSGYSNFAIFKAFPIDILKIDGSLIKDIHSSEISASIVDSILYFSKQLNIEVVAEYVHSEEVLKKIKSIGMDYGQGFYLGKPSNDLA